MSQFTNTTLTGFRIEVIRQSASAIEHPLEEGRSMFVGRSDSCGIQIKGDGVADIHCLIDVDDDTVSIQDWASDAGTKVNGKAIDDKTPIQAGDSVVVGSVTLKLAGKPDRSNVNDPSKPTEEEPREESVGMEKMGYDLSEGDAPEQSDPSPIVQPSAGRLSDSFGEPTPEAVLQNLIDDAIDDVSAVETVDEITADLSDSVGPAADPVISPAAESVISPAAESVIETAAEPVIETAAVRFEQELGDLDDDQNFTDNSLTEADLDWDPSTFDDDQMDAEIVELLKSEIEDLRIQVAERDEQLAAMAGLESVDHPHAPTEADSGDRDFGATELVGRVDDLLGELAEHDERVSTLQDLLETAEIQNQAQHEERNCLETWVGEIEQRIGERESEWQAEQDALRSRLQSACEERDQFQQKLHVAAKRYGKASIGEVVPDEMLEKLQKQNSELQTALQDAEKQCGSQARQIERLQAEDPESLQAERADVAQEKAAVARMRFQLSKQLQEIGEVPEGEAEAKVQPDREFAHKLKTLRDHLREIHEEEKVEREQKGESLFGRISSLWKRVDDEY